MDARSAASKARQEVRMHRSPTPARTAALVFIAAIVVANCAGGGGCDPNGCAQGCTSSSSSGCGGGCAGGGCTIEPIPGGFPRAEELPAGVQLRLSENGLDFLEKNVDPLIKQLLPTGLDFEVPPTCDQNAVIGKIHICATKSGNACLKSSPACKISAAISGLTITPDATKNDVLKVSARLSAKTPTGAPLRTSGLVSCTIDLDTAWAGKSDAGFAIDLRFAVDPVTKRTSLAFENAAMTDLDGGDISVKGGFLCTLIDLPFIKTFLVNMVKNQVSGMVSGMVDEQLCARCDQAACPSGATCDPQSKLCMLGKSCLQVLGLEGRVPLTMIPGAQGKLDFLSWLGGSVNMPAGGVTLGMIGGSAPEKPASCVKPQPTLKPDLSQPIPVASLLKGNVDPDGKPFDIGIAVHKRLLEQGGWAAYTAGGICLDVDSSLSEMLSTATFSLIMPSIAVLTDGKTAPVRMSIIPARPPEWTIGKGVITDDGKGNFTLVDPLLTIKLKDLAIQMYVLADERYVRILELTADLVVPIGLHVDKGEIQPVIGDLDNALSNLRIANSQLLAETSESLTTKFPIVIKLALGLLPDLINQTFPLPAMMGLELKDPRFTGIENNTMLGIFASLGTAPQKTSAETGLPLPVVLPAETKARLVAVQMPRDPHVMRLRSRADLERGPRLIVDVGLGSEQPGQATDGRQLEYAWRLDGSGWSPYTRGPRLELRSSLLFLLGKHELEIRARVVGQPNSADPTPRRISVNIQSPFPSAASAETAPPVAAADQTAGCAVAAGKSPSASGAWLLLLGLLAFAARRRRHLVRGGATLALIAATALALGCSDSAPGVQDAGPDGVVPDLPPGSETAPPKVLKPGVLGRHSALVASGDTLYASAYEQTYGDLVLVSAPLTSPTNLTYEVIDGAPDTPVTADPAGYRGGVAAKGDDVGLGTDIALDAAGNPLISYHDRDKLALRFAARAADGWSAHEVLAPAAGSKEIVGRYTALVSVGGNPAIAFTVQNISKGAGAFAAELRWAVASSPAPKSASDWTISTVDASPSPCQNLCESGEACFVSGTTSACKKTATGCGTCADGTACLAGKCEPVLAKSQLADIPKAIGLWPELLAAPGGSVLLVYHDSVAGSVKAARLASASATSWSKKVAASSSAGDIVGAYPAAAVDADGLHIVHQNSTKGTLNYVRLDPTTLTSKGTAVVDDGLRPDGLHPVGADAAVVIGPAGGLRVAYQDQQTADLLVVSRSKAGAWTPNTASDANLGRLLKGGDKGYGFYTNLVTAGGSVYGSSFVFEATGAPPGNLELFQLP
jgi:MYXO-CTERM domain-containing protein